MECPDCTTEIGKANYCGCGWKKKAYDHKDDPPAYCHIPRCGGRARIKILDDAGHYINVCDPHYYDHFHRAKTTIRPSQRPDAQAAAEAIAKRFP